MNDDFLCRFRRSPRPEFVKALYDRLTQDAKVAQPTTWPSATRRIALALIAACLVFVLAITVSPAARAAVDDILAKITVRGTTVLVIDEAPAYTGGETESYSMLWTPMSPDQITADYPFFGKLPAWVPAGYVLQERAALYYNSMLHETPSFSLFQWRGDNAELIQLIVWKGSCPNGLSPHSPPSSCTLQTFFVVGLESEPQVVAVNNQPAVLLRSIWCFANLSDPVREWNPTRQKEVEGWILNWERDGRTFELAGTSGAISQEDVIRLAESIP